MSLEILVDKNKTNKNITGTLKEIETLATKSGLKIKLEPIVDTEPIKQVGKEVKQVNKEIKNIDADGNLRSMMTEFQTAAHKTTAELKKANKETGELELSGLKVVTNYKAAAAEAAKLSATQEKLRRQGQEFSKNQAVNLDKYIQKYSYGDTSELKKLQQELSKGGNFQSLDQIPQKIAGYRRQIASALIDVRNSHSLNLSSINKEISKETELQSLKDKFNARNASEIDYQIKKRELEAMQFSKQLQAQMKEVANLQANQENAFILNQKRMKTTSDFKTFLSDNPKIVRDNIQEVNRLFQAIDQVDSETDLRKVRAEVGAFKSEMKSLGLTGRTVFGKLVNSLKKFATWLGVGNVIMMAISSVKKMYANIVDLDREMTDLKKVTSETDSTYRNFLKGAASDAKKLGAEITSIVSSTADFARLGFSMPDAQELAKSAVLYSNVGDMNIDESTEALISIMKGFNIEASRSVEVIDKLNEVGNSWSISSKGIGEGLKRSASALALAGNSLDESIALITSANVVIQDPSEAGNALKILSMRLRGMKGQLEQLGEESDNVTESISKIQTQILNLTHGKVNIFKDDGSFKSTYEIMQGIASAWKDISETDQADLLEIIAGKQRGNTIAGIITQFADAEGALESSLNSAGSAMAENDKYLDSIEGKAKVLSAAFQELSKNTIDSGLVKGFIDLNTALVEGTNKVGLFKVALTGFFTFLSSKAGRQYALLPQVA